MSWGPNDSGGCRAREAQDSRGGGPVRAQSLGGKCYGLGGAGGEAVDCLDCRFIVRNYEQFGGEAADVGTDVVEGGAEALKEGREFSVVN